MSNIDLPDVGPPDEPGGIKCHFHFGEVAGDLVLVVYGLLVTDDFAITDVRGGAAMGVSGAHLQALVDEIRRVAEERGITIV